MLGALLDNVRPKRPAVHLLALEPESGMVRVAAAMHGVNNASWLALHPSADMAYAVGETQPGSVSALRLPAESGDPAPLNAEPSAGNLPCYLTLDMAGETLYVVNYGSGTISVHPIIGDFRVGASAQVLQHRGSGQNPVRQRRAHPHAVVLSPDGRFVLVPDLGMDCVVVYRRDGATGRLGFHARTDVRAGAGPRHLAFHPVEPFVYVLNELDSTVASYEWNAEAGRLSPRSVVSTLPPGFSGDSTAADIQVHPRGHVAYVSNRGHDSMGVISIEPNGGLRFIDAVPSGGRTPRGFRLDPSGQLLLAAHQDCDVITTFEVNPGSGLLSEIRRSAVPAAVCLQFTRASASGSK